MCDKAVGTHLSTIKFIFECYKTHEICYKVVHSCFFVFYSLPDQYKSQIICDEADDDSLAVLKLIFDSFVTSKMIKKLYTAFYADDGLLFFDEDSGDVTFCRDEMGIFSVNLNIFILIIILMKMVLILLFLSEFWLGIVNLKNAFKRKTSEELMPTAWHPKRWRNFCCQKIKRRNKTVF